MQNNFQQQQQEEDQPQQQGSIYLSNLGVIGKNKKPLQGLAVNKEFKLCVVVASSMLKLLEINSDKSKLKELKFIKFRYNPVYIEWNPNNNDQLAICSDNLHIFNLTNNTSYIEEAQQSQNTGKIKICNWHPTIPNQILTYGDFLIKLWDITVSLQNPIATFQQNQKQILNIKFNPSDPDYFLAGFEDGKIQYFNIKSSRKYIYQKNVSTNAVTAIDFNTKFPGFVAIGFQDKNIGIYQIKKLHHKGKDPEIDFEEKLKIRHIHALQSVQWLKQTPTQICVTSFQMDNDITIYDITHPHKPKHLYKGHTDQVTSICFNEEEDQMISSSKDGHIILRDISTYYQLYESCTRGPAVFDLNDGIAFHCGKPNFQTNQPQLQFDEDDEQQDEIKLPVSLLPGTHLQEQGSSRERQIQHRLRKGSRDIGKEMLSQNSQNIQKGGSGNNLSYLGSYLQQDNNNLQIIQPKSTTNKLKKSQPFIEDKQSLNNYSEYFQEELKINDAIEQSKIMPFKTVSFLNNVPQFWQPNQMTYKEELQYLADNYQDKGTLLENVNHNVQIANSINKTNVAKTWEQFYQFFKNVKLPTQKTNQGEQINNDIQQVQNNNLDSNKNITQDINNNSNRERTKTQDQDKFHKKEIKIEKLYKFLEAQPAHFQKLVEDKKIRYNNNVLYYNYQSLINEYPDLFIDDMDQQNEYPFGTEIIVIESCYEILQQLVNDGDLQSALTILQVFQEFIVFKKEKAPFWKKLEVLIQHWEVSFLENLKRFELFVLANIYIVKSVLLSQKVGKYMSKCGKCNELMQNINDKSKCPKESCKSQLICCICKLPIKGLQMWCQICGHAGHFKEMGEWFKNPANKQQCPSGCGHKCFETLQFA